MLPLAYYGIGAGAQLFGKIIALRSARRQASQLRKEQLTNLRPLEGAAQAYNFAPTQGEGYAMGNALNTATRGLAARGLGDSSFVGPEGLAAVAPILQQHDQQAYNQLSDIVEQKNAIYAGTSMPGYGSAFGGVMGDAGDLLTQMGGQKEGMAQLMQMIELMRQKPTQPAGPMGPPAPADPMGPPAPAGAGTGTDFSDPQSLMDFILGFREGAMRLGFAF